MPTAETESQPPAKRNLRARVGVWLAWFGASAVVAAFAFGGYAAYQSFTRPATKPAADATTQTPPLDASIADLQQRMQTLRDDVTRAQQNLQQEWQLAREAEREQINALSNEIAKLQDQMNRGVDSWALREAEQLLLSAAQYLQLSGDAHAAMRALRFAAARLRALQTPGLAQVRGAIDAELTALQKFAALDLQDAMQQFARLREQIRALPLAGDPQVMPRETPATDEKGKNFLNDLLALVQIEKKSDMVRPPLSLERRAWVKDKAALLLESAQLAFMHRRAEIYAARMQIARDWIAQQFEPSAAETREYLARFDALATMQHAPPDVSKSLTALRRVLAVHAQ